MKKLITVAVAATAVLAALPGSASAAQEPFAKVISHVKLNKKDATATVQARYMCESSTHLWVSAKQSADGAIDPALEAEGGSSAAAAWMDTNNWGTVRPGLQRRRPARLRRPHALPEHHHRRPQRALGRLGRTPAGSGLGSVVHRR